MSEQHNNRKKLGEMGEKLYRYSEHGYTTCTPEPVCDGHPYGLFFTPDELRELARWAYGLGYEEGYKTTRFDGEYDSESYIQEFLKDEGL